jgi:hypothetical protein
MKKILLVMALLAGIQSFAQWPWEKIEGNGNLKKEKREVGSFTGVASAGSWDVMVAYGENNSIQVEGDENLLEYIETKVEGGSLNIRARKNVNLRSKNKITVYISLTRITDISLSGSGNIIGDGKFGNEGTSHFKVSGSGNIKLSFDKVKEVETSISGSGNIRLSGTAHSVKAHVSGSGNTDCSELVCDDASAGISGSGNVKVNANKSIEARIAGSGNVYYKGSANDIQRHIAGSGHVIKS